MVACPYQSTAADQVAHSSCTEPGTFLNAVSPSNVPGSTYVGSWRTSSATLVPTVRIGGMTGERLSSRFAQVMTDEGRATYTGATRGVCNVPAPIGFVCVFPEHSPRRPRVGGFVTIVNSAWAYCAAGVEGKHIWRQIEPTALATLALTGLLPAFVSESLIEDADDARIPAPVARRSHISKRNGQDRIARAANGKLHA